MKVPRYNHGKLYRQNQAEIDSAIRRVLESGRIDWGEEVPAFEREFSEWVGASYAVGVGSGSAALKSALLALGIGPGDEIITVANSDIATSVSISIAGAKIVWVDINVTTRCIDVAGCEASITPRTRAILAVDMYGHPADLVELRAVADKHGLLLVEDACLALGAKIGGRKIGTFADVTCFSFGPGKHLPAYGDAGACTTENADIASRIQKICAIGQDREWHYNRDGAGAREFHHETIGLNEKMDELQAAVLRAKLRHLDDSLRDRHQQAERYSERLSGVVDIPLVKDGYTHAWRNYVIETEGRDALSLRLSQSGIASSLAYSPPTHLQPLYAGRGSEPVRLPNTERCAKRLLALPLGPHLTIDEVDFVVDSVRDAMREQ